MNYVLYTMCHMLYIINSVSHILNGISFPSILYPIQLDEFDQTNLHTWSTAMSEKPYASAFVRRPFITSFRISRSSPPIS